MKNFEILFTERKIQITKSFAAKAKNPASNEYKELMSVCDRHPAFEIVLRESGKTGNRKCKSGFNGLTYDYMVNYINNHSEAEETIAEYNSKRDELACYHSAKAYSEIKKWFLEKYPEIKKYAPLKKNERRAEV